jgi:hypothetical protein
MGLRRGMAAVVGSLLAVALYARTPVWAADKAGCQDPPWVSARLPGFAIEDCDDKAWVSDTIELPGGGRTLEAAVRR